MPAVLRRGCASCNESHELCFTGGDMMVAGNVSNFCPVTNNLVKFMASEEYNWVDGRCPPGS